MLELKEFMNSGIEISRISFCILIGLWASTYVFEAIKTAQAWMLITSCVLGLIIIVLVPLGPAIILEQMFVVVANILVCASLGDKMRQEAKKWCRQKDALEKARCVIALFSRLWLMCFLMLMLFKYYILLVTLA